MYDIQTLKIMSNPSDWEQMKIYSSTWKMDEYVEVFIDTKVEYKGNYKLCLHHFCCEWILLLQIESRGTIILGYPKIPTRETKPGFSCKNDPEQALART